MICTVLACILSLCTFSHRDPSVDKDTIENDSAHSLEHNGENHIKKFQIVKKLQKFQNKVLACSLVPLSEKFQCTSLIFIRIL